VSRPAADVEDVVTRHDARLIDELPVRRLTASQPGELASCAQSSAIPDGLTLSSPLLLFWRQRRQTSSTAAWAFLHIPSHVSRSLYPVTLDEVVGRPPYRACTHHPRKASPKRGNSPRTTFRLAPPPPLVRPSMGVRRATADK